MRRSKGITALAIFYGFFGITSLINVLIIGRRIASYEASHYTLPEFYVPTMKIVSFISGSTGIAISIGLYFIHEWGRKFALIRESLFLVYSIAFFYIFTYNYQIPYLQKAGIPIFSAYIKPAFSLVFVAFIFWYLTRPAVKIQFKKA